MKTKMGLEVRVGDFILCAKRHGYEDEGEGW